MLPDTFFFSSAPALGSPHHASGIPEIHEGGISWCLSNSDEKCQLVLCDQAVIGDSDLSGK